MKSRVAVVELPAASRRGHAEGVVAVGEAGGGWSVPAPEQGPNASVPVSIEQMKAAVASEELKAKAGRASFVGPLGPESIATGGAWVSTTKVREAGVGSTPAASRARA